MTTAAYLDRLGFDRTTGTDVASGATPALGDVARLQRAHVESVPFETLAITGDPFDDADDGAGVVLDVDQLHGKVVERERGGFCFELNGLFHALLDALGVDVDRVAARVVGADGTGRPPANHLANVVTFDRRYLVDVGMGVPTMRRPLPLDGTVRTDRVGVAWRVVDCSRPDEQYTTQYRRSGDGDWHDRYIWSDRPRRLSYFEATCDYLQSAPESPFTGDPVVSLATPEGHVELGRETLTRHVDGGTDERAVAPGEWHEVLAETFGVRRP